MTATILAIDSSIGISSVSITHGDKPLVYLENSQSGKQAAELMPLIEEALRQAGLTYRDLSRIACTVGPGSFTGIRIGLASARGIGFAAAIPCVGYTTLEVMAHAAFLSSSRAQRGDPSLPEKERWIAASPAAPRNDNSILCILNAGKGEVFYQSFGTSPTDPAIGRLEDILARFPHHVIASSMPLPAPHAAPSITHPRADALAQLAFAHPERALPPSPFYIRPPDAKKQFSVVRVQSSEYRKTLNSEL